MSLAQAAVFHLSQQKGPAILALLCRRNFNITFCNLFGLSSCTQCQYLTWSKPYWWRNWSLGQLGTFDLFHGIYMLVRKVPLFFSFFSFSSSFCNSNKWPYLIFSIHNVRRHYLPFLRWSTGILWRFCILPNNILCKAKN